MGEGGRGGALVEIGPRVGQLFFSIFSFGPKFFTIKFVQEIRSSTQSRTGTVTEGTKSQFRYDYFRYRSLDHL